MYVYNKKYFIYTTEKEIIVRIHTPAVKLYVLQTIICSNKLMALKFVAPLDLDQLMQL